MDLLFKVRFYRCLRGNLQTTEFPQILHQTKIHKSLAKTKNSGTEKHNTKNRSC